MVDIEHLKAVGRRASEIGRLRRAIRISWPLLPVTAVCLFETRERETCALFALVLVCSTIWLRWRDRQGHEIATTGLLAGTIPLVVGVIQASLHGDCIEAADVSCIAFLIVGGSCAGALIFLREVDWYARRWSCAMAGGIAALAGSLGCVRLGFLGLLSATLGILMGGAGAAVADRKPA